MAGNSFVTGAEGTGAVIRLPDPAGTREKVGLWCDLDLEETTFTRVDEGWELRLTDLPVACLEYLLEVDGETRTDATNPLTVPGPFGEHSWLPLSGYVPPGWLALPQAEGALVPRVVTATPVGDVDVTVWTPSDAEPDEPLPMLCSHDGPEMVAYGGLLDLVRVLVDAGRVPRLRLALLSPGPRNERYAANPAYAEALTGHVLPELLAAHPSEHRPVLAGQSLGGLAALHAAWTSPGAFAGLLLQSGSFFTPELDLQESGFAFWDGVTGFVATVLAATTAAQDAPVVAMTCGSAEENYANNVLLRDHLRSTGLDVTWGEVRQGHTWTCWRDTLDPHLADLLGRAWS